MEGGRCRKEEPGHKAFVESSEDIPPEAQEESENYKFSELQRCPESPREGKETSLANWAMVSMSLWDLEVLKALRGQIFTNTNHATPAGKTSLYTEHSEVDRWTSKENSENKSLKDRGWWR